MSATALPSAPGGPGELLQATREVLARWPLSVEEASSWRSRARCRGFDPEFFYPGRGESLEPVRAICRQCPVRAHCLATALADGEKFGTWAGVSEDERRALRRQMMPPSANRPGRARIDRVPA